MTTDNNDISAKPIVYLVGAGPGDPDLITVRGSDLIRRAHVIIYDNLVSPRLLSLASPDAELIYVGKKAAHHSLPQEKINQLIINKAQPGRVVVRLKGGDPFVFGRGGEEALELSKAGIDFEIVPGITAGLSVPAYAGIPVTHRDFASELALITGHEDASRTGPEQIDWPALASWQGTLIFYMGVKNLPTISQKLQKHGMSPDTPAALIRWGTTPAQQTLTGTLSSLPDLAQQHQFTPPAIIVIGQVVPLRQHLQWFEKRPLFGRRIIVTRARAQASRFCEMLSGLGADVLEFPTIRIEPPAETQPLYDAVANLGGYDWVIFTSPNGVESFFDCLLETGSDARRFGSVNICSIGPSTAAQLSSYGLTADLIPDKFLSTAIVEALTSAEDLSGKRILLPRADIAPDDLPQALRNLGAHVDEITAYQTVIDDSPKDQIIEAIQQDSIDWITFTSSSTVRNFLSQIDLKILSGKKLRLASIGPQTSATIKQAQLNIDVQASEHTIPGLVNAILNFNPKT